DGGNGDYDERREGRGGVAKVAKQTAHAISGAGLTGIENRRARPSVKGRGRRGGRRQVRLPRAPVEEVHDLLVHVLRLVAVARADRLGGAVAEMVVQQRAPDA